MSQRPACRPGSSCRSPSCLARRFGAINGLLVWKLDIPSIVVTLGTMTIFRGVIFLLTDGAWINAHEMSDAFKAVPREVILGLPVLSWVAILIIGLFYVLMTRTALGRSLLCRRRQSDRRRLCRH